MYNLLKVSIDPEKKILFSPIISSIVSISVIIGGLIVVMNNVSTVDSLIQDTYPTTINVIDLKFHLTSIELWLTNVSATRGIKGYNEGFQKAGFHYRKSLEIIDRLIERNKAHQLKRTILMEIRNKISSYPQAGIATARAYIDGGTGLGLTICHFIIANSHNGSIAVGSEIDRGSTFTITLPID